MRRLAECDRARRSTKGREIGPNGRVIAWHFRIDAGFLEIATSASPPADVVHVYDPDDCASGAEGSAWFSPVVIDLNELSGYQDSTAVKQHLALENDHHHIRPRTSTLLRMRVGWRLWCQTSSPEPASTVEPGRTVESFQPPANRDYRDFVKVNRDEIAMCLGAVPEDLSGDYRGMSWTVARASLPQALDAKRWTPRLAGYAPALEDVYDWVQWAMGGRVSRDGRTSDEMDWRHARQDSNRSRPRRDREPSPRPQRLP